MTSGIVWEDATALVVDKPSGILVHNSPYAGRKERSLRQEIGAALGRRVFPVHRLDRGTSGLIVLARERAEVRGWQERLGRASAVKCYLAIVRGRLEQSHELDYPLRDSAGRDRDARSVVVPIAVAARERCTLSLVRTFTGRQHQVRRHLAHLRHPIVNDATHGDSKFNRAFRAAHGLDRLALHACTLVVDALTDDREQLRLLLPPSGRLLEAIEQLLPELEIEALLQRSEALTDIARGGTDD